MKDSLRDRENDRFRDANGLSKVAVTIEGDTGLLEGVSYDEIQATYPTPSTELYTYKLASATVAQIQVSYTNSSKHTLASVIRL